MFLQMNAENSMDVASKQQGSHNRKNTYTQNTAKVPWTHEEGRFRTFNRHREY